MSVDPRRSRFAAIAIRLLFIYPALSIQNMSEN